MNIEGSLKKNLKIQASLTHSTLALIKEFYKATPPTTLGTGLARTGTNTGTQREPSEMHEKRSKTDSDCKAFFGQ